MSLDTMRVRIHQMDDLTLLNEYQLYTELVSLSVNDQLYIDLLECELYERKVIV